jgi:protein-disulfide isomerase
MSVLRVAVTPDDHIRGNSHAPVTLVEYGDYECPYCRLADTSVKRAHKHFGDKLKSVFRHFPLTQIHPHAQSAAEAAEFAGAQGRFWQMHDDLYDNQDRLDTRLLFSLADALRLSERALRSALETGQYAPKVHGDFLGGVRSGVNGTPTFFVNGRRHEAPFDYECLAGAIASARSHAKASI